MGVGVSQTGEKGIETISVTAKSGCGGTKVETDARSDRQSSVYNHPDEGGKGKLTHLQVVYKLG